MMGFPMDLTGVSAALKDELLAIVNAAKNDATGFLKQQGEALESNLDLLASGQISPGVFEVSVRDIKRQAEVFALDRTVAVDIAARERAKKLALNIGQIVLTNLLNQLRASSGPAGSGPRPPV